MVDAGPSLAPIAVDRVAIEQVLINLIRNAADSIADSGRSARSVMLRASSDDSRRVKIAVSDTGKGIERELLGKIFQPLFTTKADGMGMGLAIVRSIIESHNSAIHVHSGPGGATFEFSLPAANDK